METINLDDSMIIGKGGHKVVYRDPRDKNRCIKIMLVDDADIYRELKYRKIRKQRGKTSKILTRYYGMVQTNKGVGYLYEYVTDYDGKLSLPINEFFKMMVREKKWTESEASSYIKTVLERFKTEFVNEIIIVTNIEFVNFFVQRHSKDEYDISLRVIDNIGIRTLIPLVGYVDYFGKRYCEKYWQRLIDELKRDKVI